MRVKSIIIYSALCFLFFSLNGQDIPIGSWRNHADYTGAKIIEKLGTKVFCATSTGIFYYDLEDESINTISTIDGLSGVEPSALHISSDNKTLIIAYKNGSIDFIDSDLSINSFTNIKTSTDFTNKEIRSLATQKNILYAATDFGVALISPDSKQIIDSYENLGVSGGNLAINHILLRNDYLYLSTDSGILRGVSNNDLNLKDFRNWERFTINDTVGIIESIIFQGEIYSRTNTNAVYKLNANNQWAQILEASMPITSFSIENDELKCTSANKIYVLQNTTFTETVTLNQGGIIEDIANIANHNFIAHNTQGLAIISGNDIVQSIIPSGPKGKINKLIQVEEYTIALSNDKPGFSFFQNGIWQVVAKTAEGENLPFFADATLDLLSGNALFLSSTEGVYSWDTREISKVNFSNTQNIQLWRKLATSPLGNVWALVEAGNNLGLFDTQSSELFVKNINKNTLVNDYIIAPNGDQFLSTNTGLIVALPEEAEIRTLSSSVGNGNLPSNATTDLSIDLTGNLWIGTENGIAYLSNFTNVFNAGLVNAVVPIFEGFFLFQGIKVNSIQSDGGNRLWVSNRDGLWVFDEDIQENIFRFTSDNSPLVVNKVNQQVINPINGEVFILTDEQFLSYRSASSRASTEIQQVKIFPNPVSLNNHSNVSINGLAQNMEVMVTDLAGNLLYKAEANGGTFSWDLFNYNGVRAKPGIYLIFSVDNFGEQSFKGKFVVTK